MSTEKSLPTDEISNVVPPTNTITTSTDQIVDRPVNLENFSFTTPDGWEKKVTKKDDSEIVIVLKNKINQKLSIGITSDKDGFGRDYFGYDSLSKIYPTNDPAVKLDYTLYRPCKQWDEESGVCVSGKTLQQGGLVSLTWYRPGDKVYGSLGTSLEIYDKGKVVGYISKNDEQEVLRAVQQFISSFKFNDIKQ